MGFCDTVHVTLGSPKPGSSKEVQQGQREGTEGVKGRQQPAAKMQHLECAPTTHSGLIQAWWRERSSSSQAGHRAGGKGP